MPVTIGNMVEMKEIGKANGVLDAMGNICNCHIMRYIDLIKQGELKLA